MESRQSIKSIVNVGSVPHRSPFRYPGGKTWLVPRIRHWMASLDSSPAELVEPFAGGGIIGLTALFENFVRRLTLIELDRDIGAVWRAVLGGHSTELAERIVDFQVTEAAVRAILESKPRRNLDVAFAAIVRNRMQRGGIMAPGASLMKSGENGKGLRSRWYAQTLKRRILDIHERRQQIRFIRGDGLAFLRAHVQRSDLAFFIDPPYTVAGRRLYAHGDVDHDELFRIASRLSGPFVMTYDNAEPVRQLAMKYGLDYEPVPMKSTHHAVMSELLIGRDLSWVRTQA